MQTRKQCPDCDSYDTERVHIEWYTDMIEETRICDGDCGGQYTNKYSLFAQEIDEMPMP